MNWLQKANVVANRDFNALTEQEKHLLCRLLDDTSTGLYAREEIEATLDEVRNKRLTIAELSRLPDGKIDQILGTRKRISVKDYIELTR